MRRYTFGYLFVRLAKTLAFLALVGGLGIAGMRYVQGSLEASSLRYEASSMLGSKLFKLAQEWDHARAVVTRFFGGATASTTVLQFADVPETPAGFEGLLRKLSVFREERDAMKSTMVRKFESSLLEIESKLRAHASSLAVEAPPRNPQELSQQNPASRTDASTAHKTLFASLEHSEVNMRRQIIEETADLIAVLQSSSESPENERILGGAVDELENLERLLPDSLEIAPPRIEVTTKQGSDAASPTPKLNAERVAEQLQQSRARVRAALLTDWSVDFAFDEVFSEAEQEREKCQRAELALKRLWLNIVYAIVLVLLVSCCSAFIILVHADLTQAFLDTATNSSIVASAYQSSQQWEGGGEEVNS